jgi:hypothetical protein
MRPEDPERLPDVPALRVLEPPPGGLAVLRERLDRAPRRRWVLAIPAVAAAAVLAFVLLGGRPPRTASVPVPAAASTVLRDRSVAGDVQFYWVSSIPAPTARAASQIVSIDKVPTVGDYVPPSSHTGP